MLYNIRLIFLLLNSWTLSTLGLFTKYSQRYTKEECQNNVLSISPCSDKIKRGVCGKLKTLQPLLLNALNF